MSKPRVAGARIYDIYANFPTIIPPPLRGGPVPSPLVPPSRGAPMPIVNIDVAWLNRLLGQQLPPERLHESLDQIGCDVEDVVDVQYSRCPQCGSLVEHPLGQDEVKTCGMCGCEREAPFA